MYVEVSYQYRGYEAEKRNNRLIINSKSWDGSGRKYYLLESTAHLSVKFMLLLLPDYWPVTACLLPN
jgi:hypothetical protein